MPHPSSLIDVRLRLLGVAGVLSYVLGLGLPIDQRFSLFALAAGAVILLLHPAEERNPYAYALCAALLAFLAMTAASIAGSPDARRALTTNLSWLPGTLLCYAVASRLKLREAWWLAWGLVVSGGAVSLWIVVIAYTHAGATPAQWLALAGYPHLKVPNDLLFLAVIAPFGVASVLAAHRRRQSAAALAVLLLSLTVIVASQSRSAFLVLLFSVSVTILLLRPGQVGPVVLALLAAALVADALTGFGLAAKFTGLWGSRIPLWQAAGSMFADAPYMGHGPGAFSVLGPRYLAAVPRPEWAPIEARHVPWVHNLYLELLAERGIFGFISFFMFFGLMLWLAWIAYRRATLFPIRSLAAALAASGAAVLLGGAVELSLLRHWLIILLSLHSGFAMALIREANTTQTYK